MKLKIFNILMALALVFTLGLATAIPVGAKTIDVTPLSSIQAAIDLADPGDIISVGAGTYDLTSPIVVDEDVTIIGDIANPSNVIINAPTGGVDMDCFQIKASGVTIQGFLIQGALDAPSGDGFQNAGVMIGTHWVGAPIKGLQDINISYNKFVDCSKGIFMYHVKDSTVSYNTFTTTEGQNPDNFTDTTGWGGDAVHVYLWDESDYPTGNTISHNIMDNVRVGVFLNGDHISGTDPSAWDFRGTTIEENTMTNVWNAGIVLQCASGTAGLPITINLNDIITSTGRRAGDEGNERGLISVHGDYTVITGNTLTNSEEHGLWIDGSHHTVTSNLVTSNTKDGIHAGWYKEVEPVNQWTLPDITRADISVSNNTFQNNTVQVGDPTEALDMEAVLGNNTFDRAVVVRGNPIKVPTIFSSIQDGIDAAVAGDTVDVAAGTYQEGDIRINESVTIQGAGRLDTIVDATGKNAGFYIDTDDVTIKDLTVKNSIYRNITIYSTTVSNVTIDNVASLDSLASGLEVHHSTVNNLVINNCLFSGNGLHGMRVDSAGVVNGMTITGSHFDGNDAGMTIYGDTNDVVILNSTFNNNVARTGNLWTGGYGIYIGNANGSTKTNTGWLIDGCQFKDNHYDHPNYPSIITFSHGIALSPYMAGSIISNITISNTEFSGNQEMGFRAFSVIATDISAITIEYCDFIGMVYGIRLTGEGATDFQVHYCNFDGNSEYGIYNSSPMIDALYNWWGDVTGPAHATLNTNAQGNAVSDDVLFSPWLYEPKENFVSDAPFYAGSVVLGNEATEVIVNQITSFTGGWNSFSTPVTLDSSADTWGELLDLVAGSELSILRAQRFDPASQGWVPVVMNNMLVGLDYPITPGEGFFIQVETEGSLPILCHTNATSPPMTNLVAGWNLIGLSNLSSMAVKDALYGVDYSVVLSASPPNSLAWSVPPGDPEIKDMLLGEAYWVAMGEAGILFGFTTTPVAVDMTWGLNQIH